LTIRDSEDLAGCDITQRTTKDDVQSHSSTSERNEKGESKERAHDFE